MILGKLDHPASYGVLCQHPVWQEAFGLLEQFATSQPPGLVEIRPALMYASFHRYATKPRSDCRYESHRTYVDLQYCVSGGEIIEWSPVKDLTVKTAYNPEKDVTHYHLTVRSEAELIMTAGSFAIFFPEDGHLPKLSDGLNSEISKVVIKIDRSLLLTGVASVRRPEG